MVTRITLLILFFVSSLVAATGTISGLVTDAETGEPLIGSNVVVEGTQLGAATNIDGYFSIKLLPPGNYTIRVSYIGYESKLVENIRVTADDSIFIEVELEYGGCEVSEVVVTGKKIFLEKSTNTVKVIDSERIQRLPVKGVKNLSSLQSGITNNNTAITIRGGRSTETPYFVEDNSGFNQYIQSAPWNTEEYNTIVENEFLDAFSNPLSTFSIDVDAASYSNVRRFIQAGQLPPKDAVRIEEFVNYFDYDYQVPTDEKPFLVFTELGACPWNKENYLLHIGIKGKELSAEERNRSNLVFLLDVSGSMQPENKLPLLKKAFKFLVNNLEDYDNVAIVVYAGSAGLVLPVTKGKNKNKIINALDNLHAGGSTAGGAGIKLAYKIAEENFVEGGNNRIVLATDGDFNVGVSNTSELVEMIEKKREKGIFLTILGFGMGNYKDGRLEELADKGNGNYFYIDNILEARKVFHHDLMGTLFTIAKDVKIQIEFNPVKVKSYRLVGYENRLLKKEDFDDDTKDAGELGAGHTVTAIYEVVTVKEEINFDDTEELKYQVSKIKDSAINSDELLTLKLRYKLPDEDESKLITSVVKDELKPETGLSDNFNFSTAVAGFAMLLRESKFKGKTDFELIKKLADKSLGDDKYGYRDEFFSLVKRSKRLSEELSLLETPTDK